MHQTVSLPVYPATLEPMGICKVILHFGLLKLSMACAGVYIKQTKKVYSHLASLPATQMSFRILCEGYPRSTLWTHLLFSTSGRWSQWFSSATNSWSSATSSLWTKPSRLSRSSLPSARDVRPSPKLSCWKRGEKLLTSVAFLSWI